MHPRDRDSERLGDLGEVELLDKVELHNQLKAFGSITIASSTGPGTGSVPWNGGAGANNWSLSAGRAEATRQALMADGIGENRFRRIEGVADREPLVQNNPMDPRNRRISILLMR